MRKPKNKQFNNQNKRKPLTKKKAGIGFRLFAHRAKLKANVSISIDKSFSEKQKNLKKSKNPSKPKSVIKSPFIERKAGVGFRFFSRHINLKARVSIVIIIVFTLILYGNSLYNKFSLDDHNVTYINQTIQKGIKAVPEIFTTKYAVEGDLSYGYRPLTKATFAVEYSLYGIKPAISHFINILLYIITGIVLYHILKKLLTNYNRYFPLLITLLFLAHPIHTEVVASLKNREEILSFLFGLLMLNSILKYVTTNRVWNIVWAALFFIIGILAKPTIGIFLVVVPLVLYFFTNTPAKKIIMISGGVLLLFLIIALIPKFFISPNVRPMMFYENPLYFEKSLWLRIGTGFFSLLYYLRLLLFPHPLLFYYGYDMIPIVNLANGWVILSVLFHLFIFIYAILKIRDKHLLSFAILFYLIMMAVYSNIVMPSPGIIAERYLYPASLGFCIAVVWFIYKLLRIDTRAVEIKKVKLRYVWLFMILILVPYSIKTITRNKDWHDYLTLYRHDLKYLDRSVKANVLYASAVTLDLYNEFEQDKIDKDVALIKKHYSKALEIYPDNYEVLNNYGSFYSNTLDDYNTAIPMLQKSIALRPDISEPYYNLGYAWFKLNDFQKAIENYRKALDLDPNNVSLRSDLANLYFKTGDFNSAVKLNEELIQLAPASDLPYINIGNYYLQSSDTVSAIAYWERAVSKLPQYKLCMNLSNYYRNLRDTTKALFYYNMALQAKKKK
jgi:tetratricopeptide (TPR) repeat protein